MTNSVWSSLFGGGPASSISASSGDSFERTGFVTQSDSTLSFDDGTMTLSVQPTSSAFTFYQNDVKYSSSGDTKATTDVEGNHVFYYDLGNLGVSVNPSDAAMDVLIRTKALVAIVYWDSDNAKHIRLNDERHGLQMDGSTHAYHHFINGLRYLSGLGLDNMSVDGTGTTADAQFGVEAGEVSDEDLYKAISSITSTTGLPIYYMEGSQKWRKTTVSGFSARTYDGTSATRLAYNQFTGGLWQLTEVGNNDFVLYHVFATTDLENPMVSVMGQNTYANIAAARAGAKVEIQTLTQDQLVFPETRAIATVIMKTNLSYANDINALIVSTDTGDNYIDWRSQAISRTEAPSPTTPVEKCQLRVLSSAATVITALETYYPVAGTFTDGECIGFSVSAGGTMTYNGDGGVFLVVGNSDINVDKACSMDYALEYNGAVDTTSVTPHTFTAANKIEGIGINRFVSITAGATLRVVTEVTSAVGTVSLTANTLYLTVKGE